MEGTSFGSDGIWILALLYLFGMGNGFGGYGANGRFATVEDLNTSANFTRLEAQVRDNAGLTERKADAISSGICSLGYEMAEKFGQVNTAMAQQTATIIAGQQSIKDMIAQNKIEALQARIQSLELAAATGNVVRYPTSSCYSAGTNPFCGCNGNGIAY